MRKTASWLVGTSLFVACSSPCAYTWVGEVCGAQQVEVPIVGEQGWPVIEARIGERPVRLLVDTGAGSTVVSATLLGLTDHAWHKLERLCIGALCVEHALVWAEDNELVRADPQERQVHGLLGAALLRYALLELDRGQTVRLDFARNPCAGQAVSLSYDSSSRPFAEIAIDSMSIGSVLLDTGALYTVLSQQTVDGLAPYVREGAMQATACDVHGCNASAALSQVRSLCVGDQCEADVQVKFPVWDALGNSFFVRGRYAFDARAAALIHCGSD